MFFLSLSHTCTLSHSLSLSLTLSLSRSLTLSLSPTDMERLTKRDMDLARLQLLTAGTDKESLSPAEVSTRTIRDIYFVLRTVLTPLWSLLFVFSSLFFSSLFLYCPKVKVVAAHLMTNLPQMRILLGTDCAL